MATLDEIFSDPKAIEQILRGLIGAGTAAAGVSQATRPQTTTTVRGAPPAPSALETETLGLGFGTLASQLPGQGITRTATGLSFQPTPEEQQSALGLNRAIRALQSRVGGGPVSLQGPADALSAAALTRQPTFDRSRLIAAIESHPKFGRRVAGTHDRSRLIAAIESHPKFGRRVAGTQGQGGVLNLERGQDGVFSLPTASGGAFNVPSSAVNFPSNAVDFPSSAVGPSPRVRPPGSGGGAGSLLAGATGVLGAGAGVLQIAKALGAFGPPAADPMAQAAQEFFGFPVSEEALKVILQAQRIPGVTAEQIQLFAAKDFMKNMSPDLKSVLDMGDSGTDFSGASDADLEAIRGTFPSQELLFNAPQIPSNGGFDLSALGSEDDFGNFFSGGDASGFLGTAGSVLGLGTGIAGLASGGGNTASKVLGGISTAVSAANLASTLGLTPVIPFLGPIGIIAGIGSLFAKLFGGGPSKHKLKSPQRRAAAANAGLGNAQGAGFDITQEEADALGAFMQSGASAGPLKSRSVGLIVAQLEGLRAKGGRAMRSDADEQLQAELQRRGLPTGSADEIGEAYAIQTIGRSGLSAPQQIAAIEKVRSHFAERRASKLKEEADRVAAGQAAQIRDGDIRERDTEDGTILEQWDDNEGMWRRVRSDDSGE